MKQKQSTFFLFVITLLLWGLQSVNVSAQINKLGTPYIVNYLPTDYNAFAQNWQAIQDKRGIMYFANNTALLEYDGSTWQRLTTREGEMFRALAVDSSGALYFSTSERFGFVYPDDNGMLKLVFLSDYLKVTGTRKYEIWKIICLHHYVYFFSEKYLFRYDKKQRSIRKWDLNNGFFQIYSVFNNLYLSSFDNGLMLMHNDSIVEVENGSFFSNMAIVSVLPFCPDSAYFVTYYEGIFKAELNGSKTSGFTPLNPGLNQWLSDKNVYVASLLKNGRIAMGTLGYGMIVIDQYGNVEDIIDEQCGIVSNNISNIFIEESILNNDIIWLCTDKGISKTEYFSPVRIIDKSYGIKGFVLDFMKSGKYFYVATTEGVYYYNTQNENGRLGFEKIPNINCAAWSFLKLHMNNQTENLYVCTSEFLYQITDKNAVAIPGDFYIYTALQSEKNKNTVYLGLDKGLAKATVSGNSIQISGSIKNSGVTGDIRKIVEDADGSLWLLSTKDGLIHFDTRNEKLIKNYSQSQDTILKKTAALHVKTLFKYNQQIFIGAEEGIYMYNHKTKNFVSISQSCMNKAFSKLFTLCGMSLSGDIGLALIEKNKKLKIIEYDFALKTFERLPYSRILDDDLWSMHDNGNRVLFIGSTDKIYSINKSQRKIYNNPFNTLIRKITLNGDSVIFWGANHVYAGEEVGRIVCLEQNPADYYKLKYAYNNIGFEYACPYFEAEHALMYSYYLKGNDNNWSEWTYKTEKEYTNLSEGEYTFMVKARNIHGYESQIASCSFTVLPPWYRTVWAYIGYFILAVLIVMGIIKLSIYRLQKINEAYGKYLPGSFLKMLDKRRIIDFKLGDMAEKEMTIMFSDIRSYTNLSESMSPHDNFRFLVKYLKQIGEMLNKNKGFPVQYYGDGVMAMFHGKTDYPVHAAIDMHKQVALYSADRVKKGRRPINIGVGLHTGNVIMGIRGDDWRWEGGIVGDSVNIASRIEGLTKMFGASTILTEDVFTRLEKPNQFHFRYLGKVQVKGKEKPLKIYELLDGENPETFSSKIKILDAFNEAVHCFLNNDWNKALTLFNEVMSEYDDKATAYYISIIQEVGVENAAATNKTIVINSK